MARWDNCVISDLHVGSWRFDYPALARILEAAEQEKISCRRLHLLGDLLEGKLNHRGQLYEALPLDLQRAELERVIREIVWVLRPKEIFILAGNHDRKYSIDLLEAVVESLRKQIKRRKIEYIKDEYYVSERTLYIHGLLLQRGSDYTGLTANILANLEALVRSVEGGNFQIERVILGHYHRGIIEEWMFRDYVVVPSFQFSKKPLRNERAILLFNENGTYRWVRTFPTDPRTLRERLILLLK